MIFKLFGVLEGQVALEALEGTIKVDLLPVLHHSPLPAEFQTTLWTFDEGSDLNKSI